MPEMDLYVAPDAQAVRVSLEPAFNGLNSLVLLNKADRLSGLDEWVTRTAAAAAPEVRRRHHLVFNGFYFALLPQRSFPSFPTYVAALAAEEPVRLRDRLLDTYDRIPPRSADATPPDRAALLASEDTFLRYLLERFPPENVDPGMEAEAHTYLNDPPAMQALIVSHLEHMWTQVLAPEWARVTPMLQAAVAAMRQLPLDQLSLEEAARQITGQELDLETCWDGALEKAERVVFVPSAHLGPYLGRFAAGDTVWVLYGARSPAGFPEVSPELSRADLLVRLNALADDTRLRIIRLILDRGECSSKDIMSELELSQSAASRHLKQLSASGYLKERRCDGAKCYSLNPERVRDLLQALSGFLLGDRSPGASA